MVPVVAQSPPPGYLITVLGKGIQYGLFDEGEVTDVCYTIDAAPQACCFSDGTCEDATPNECLFIGGVPQGAGTTCASTPCVATAVESKSWGRLKGLYR